METNNKEKNKQTHRGGVLGFFWRHAAGEKRWLLLALAAMFVYIVANSLIPQVFRFAVDAIIGGDAGALPPFVAGFLGAPGGLSQYLVPSAVFIMVLAALAGAFNFFARMAAATGTERFCQKLRDRLFRHVQYLPFRWQVENQTGDIIQRCTSDLDMVRIFAAQHLLEVVRTAVLIVVTFALMFSMNVQLALVSLAFVPIIGTYTTIFYRLVGKRFLAADEAEGELTINVQENLTGVRVARAFGREKFELDRFDGFNNKFAQLWIRLGKTLSISWGVGDIATGLQIFTVVVAGAFMAAGGSLSLGEFLVFVSYNQTLAWPIRALGRVLSEMSKTGVSAARIEQILDAEEEPPEPAAQKPNLATDIRFENVTFGYGDAAVLRDLSFTIPRGSTFGILGATGSGKSTITYLLNRLYELPPGLGNIWFGDVNIRDIDRYYLRRNVGLVLQEPFLFSKTLEENIAIADPRPAPDRRRVSAAAGVAAVDDAISAFARGYETVVGERGVTLSGGQKQRVAIARTLMLNAPVMIFDDSLSAVDLDTDARIRRALKEQAAGATVILISHRINTLMAADNILVLEEGKMAAFGTHRDLIARPGLYKRIYDMQSAAAADAGESLETLGGGAREGGAADA